MKGKKWLIWLIFFIAATFYDYQITDFLYHPDSLIAQFFAHYAYIPLVLCITLYFSYEKKSYFKYFGYLSGFYILYLLTNGLLYNIRMMISFIFCIPCYRLIKNIFDKSEYKSESLYEFLKYISIVIVLSLISINFLKVFWGRLRYRDMIDSSMFTPWYVIQMFSGNFSFPSGHTMIASTSLCFLELKNFISLDIKNIQIINIFVYVYITVMIFTRLILGAHFLSDTLMAFAIVSLISEFIYKKMEVVHG